MVESEKLYTRKIHDKYRATVGGYWYLILDNTELNDTTFLTKADIKVYCSWRQIKSKNNQVLIVEIYNELSPFYKTFFKRTKLYPIKHNTISRIDRIIYMNNDSIVVEYMSSNTHWDWKTISVKIDDLNYNL